MGVLGQYGANALKYWGSILTSAYQGASTADMWSAIRVSQQNYGLAKPGASAPDVSVLRGYANRIVAAATTLAAAARSDSITPAMMATAPYTSRDLASIAASPVYHVRFLNTVQAEDGSVTQTWQTSVFTATDMPSTVGDLLDQIDFNASELAAQASGSSINTPKGVSIQTSNHEITLVLGHAGRSPLPRIE